MADNKLRINEIFHSIQGESTWVGARTVFVRTTGCNLRCTYCDTKYSYYEGEWFTLDDLLTKIQSYQPPYVCITGGEPLLQKQVWPLTKQLLDLGIKVSIETSGSISCLGLDPRAKLIIDVKTPDSGAANSFVSENLQYASDTTEFKFVISSENDFLWAEKFCLDNNLFGKHIVLYSPSYGVIDERWLAQRILQEKSSARLQLQLHKYIWSADVRGV